jgi:ketosteroid isomerase-like protein
LKGILMKRALLAGLLTTLVLVVGCKSQADNKDAIRDGVVKHLAGMNGLNVNNMTITVTKATVNGDKAQADVDIRAKNGDPNAPAMQLTYELQKQGDEWVVLKGQAIGGMQHPAPGQMPPQGALPPGHPATGGTSGQIPDNHPDFNSILNSAQPPQQAPSAQQPAEQPSSNSKP